MFLLHTTLAKYHAHKYFVEKGLQLSLNQVKLNKKLFMLLLVLLENISILIF